MDFALFVGRRAWPANDARVATISAKTVARILVAMLFVIF